MFVLFSGLSLIERFWIYSGTVKCMKSSFVNGWRWHRWVSIPKMIHSSTRSISSIFIPNSLPVNCLIVIGPDVSSLTNSVLSPKQKSGRPEHSYSIRTARFGQHGHSVTVIERCVWYRVLSWSHCWRIIWRQ